MPQRDTIHNIIRRSLIKEGWDITDDPYVISFGDRFLFIDLAAKLFQNNSLGGFIGARRGDSRIAVEIKEFRGRSAISDLEQAMGHYVLYRLLLREIDPTRDLYLAVASTTFEEIFSEPIGELVLRELPLKLIVVDTVIEEVKQWIP